MKLCRVRCTFPGPKGLPRVVVLDVNGTGSKGISGFVARIQNESRPIDEVELLQRRLRKSWMNKSFLIHDG